VNDGQLSDVLLTTTHSSTNNEQPAYHSLLFFKNFITQPAVHHLEISINLIAIIQAPSAKKN